ncbi:hypothetical protein evm_000054 [Chilo suppressalis]|nr:hypothetical protein evm_000054 [Chilo suppressalis]
MKRIECAAVGLPIIYLDKLLGCQIQLGEVRQRVSDLETTLLEKEDVEPYKREIEDRNKELDTVRERIAVLEQSVAEKDAACEELSAQLKQAQASVEESSRRAGGARGGGGCDAGNDCSGCPMSSPAGDTPPPPYRCLCGPPPPRHRSHRGSWSNVRAPFMTPCSDHTTPSSES